MGALVARPSGKRGRPREFDCTHPNILHFLVISEAIPQQLNCTVYCHVILSKPSTYTGLLVQPLTRPSSTPKTTCFTFSRGVSAAALATAAKNRTICQSAFVPIQLRRIPVRAMATECERQRCVQYQATILWSRVGRGRVGTHVCPKCSSSVLPPHPSICNP